MKLLKYVCITSSLTICHSYSYIHTTPAALSHTTPAALSYTTPAALSHTTPAALTHTTPAALSHTMIMFVTSGVSCHTLQLCSHNTSSAKSHNHTLQLFTPQRRKWRESDHMALLIFTMCTDPDSMCIT